MAGLLGSQTPQRFGLLSPDVMSMIQRGASGTFLPAPAPQRAPERPRGQPGFLTQILGGTEGLEAERARRRAEEMRPQQEARMAEMRAAASRMGPAAMIAFETNPEKFGENLAEQYAPRTTGAGGRTDIFGTGQSVAAPSFSTVNDTIFRNDPLRGTSEPTATAEPAFSEVTQRFNAENPVLPANSTWVGPDGQPRAQGLVPLAPVSLPQGGSVAPFDPASGEFGPPVQGNPEPVGAGGGRNGAGNFDATTRGTLQAASSAAALARARAQDARRFIELNRANPTGTGAALMGPLAGLNPAYAEMRAISARLVPGERTPGSGPMSDGDAVLYGRAVLDIDKPGPANQALADVVIASAERDADYASFLDEYANLNGNLVGANEDWQAYVNANPLFAAGPNGQTVRRPARQIQPWRDFMGFGERQRGGSQARAGGAPAPAPSGRATHRNAQGQGIYWNGSAWVPGQ